MKGASVERGEEMLANQTYIFHRQSIRTEPFIPISNIHSLFGYNTFSKYQVIILIIKYYLYVYKYLLSKKNML